MGTKKQKNILRGWFPQELAVGIIKSVNVNVKPTPWSAIIFLTSGVLLIIAAGVSAYFGFNLLTNYRTSLANGRYVPTDYASLYVGLLSFVAFGLDLFAAMLLLFRKNTALAETLAAIVLACGLASPWIFTYFHSPLVYMYYGAFLLNGLFVSSPMIAFSLIALILVRLNRKKLNLDFNRRWSEFPFTVAGVLMIIASMPLAYNVSYLLWLLWFSGSALSSVVPAYLMALLYLVLFGLDLYIASLLLKKKRVGAASAIVGVMLAVGLPLQLFLWKSYGDPFYVFDSPTIACLIGTLILVGLNCRNLKQTSHCSTSLSRSQLGGA